MYNSNIKHQYSKLSLTSSTFYTITTRSNVKRIYTSTHIYTVQRKHTLPEGLLGLESNLIRAPPCASARLISSTRSGTSRIIMAKSRGFPVTRLNLSSSAAADEGADVDGPPDERLRGPAAPPTERRPEEEDGRWIGGGWRLLRLLPAPPPRPPPPPPPRLSLPECPYIDEVRGRFYGAL